MNWGYIGNGSWELQGGRGMVGCVYGNKMNDQRRLTIEDKTGTLIRFIGEGEIDFREAQIIVEAHFEDLLRNELLWLRYIY